MTRLDLALNQLRTAAADIRSEQLHEAIGVMTYAVKGVGKAVALCDRVSAGNEPGAHALANKVRAILTGEERDYR